ALHHAVTPLNLRRKLCFFFQAEDGIRDFHVTGVQTCALPISVVLRSSAAADRYATAATAAPPSSSATWVCQRCIAIRPTARPTKIGRASCRERGKFLSVTGELV